MDLHQECTSSRFFHQARIDRRAADELIGLAAGLIADQTINQKEAEFLKGWIETNLPAFDDPVVNILYRRLADMLADGILEPDEATDLLELLRQFTGVRTPEPAAFRASAALPLCNPVPEIIWPQRRFVFTGTMAYGPRKACEELVIERGGLIASGISKKIHYLVVGCLGNEQWLHSSYGHKIKKAVDLRDKGAPIAIINEEHWQRSVFG